MTDDETKAAPGQWTCDVCGSSCADEYASCDCDDDCHDHVATIKRLRAEVERLRGGAEFVLQLDVYERDNLLWLLNQSRRLGCDTGDWLAQIRWQLKPDAGIGRPNQDMPNPTKVDAENDRLRAEAIENKKSLRIALEAVRDQFPASVAVIREMRDEALAENERLRAALIEACDLAAALIEYSPGACKLSDSVVELRAITEGKP